MILYIYTVLVNIETNLIPKPLSNIQSPPKAPERALHISQRRIAKKLGFGYSPSNEDVD